MTRRSVDTASPDADGVTCPRCGLPAPRVVRWKQADGQHAECPRCLYTPTRELGEWKETMPDADREWYAARGGRS